MEERANYQQTTDGADELFLRPRPPSVGASPAGDGDLGLTRLPSVKKRPNASVLSDAMALALFRVGED